MNEKLFYPEDTKSLFKTYPALKNIEEFKNLNRTEMLFVWYYASESSPLSEIVSDKNRRIGALSKAFTLDADEQISRNYVEGNMPEKVREAIHRMKMFNIDIRARAKRMVEKIMTNFEAMIEVGDGDFEVVDKDSNKSIDWTGRKSYIDGAAKISEQLPALIKQVEEGFGITIKGGESEVSAIDEFHDSKKRD